MSLTEWQREEERIAEKTFRDVAPHLVKACDAILKEHPEQIVVIGTGGRGIYSVMRHLAVGLKDRGPHTRVKLADVSTKLLFGPDHYQNYQQEIFDDLHKPDSFFSERDPRRDKKVYRYLAQLGVTGRKPVLLIDTGFRGTVIKNLSEIMKRRTPGKAVGLMLFRKLATRSVETPPGLDEAIGLKIALALEHCKSSAIAPANVKVGYDFVRWKKGYRPKYETTTPTAKRLARMKHQIWVEAVDKHIAEQKKK